MFREFRCGCITSEFVGRVRICSTHQIDFKTADGQGGMASQVVRGRSKKYPAFGQAVAGWTGK